jgi:hypothetical protein
MTVGEVLVLATQALAERSLTKAKLALAYATVQEHVNGGRHQRSHKRFPYREILGDVLVVDLARLVEELHEEQRLFS